MNIYDFVGETDSYDKKERLEEKKPKSWCKSVSAFANGKGGTLIFGVRDDDTIIGLENPQDVAEKISEQIKVKLDPIPIVNIKFEKITEEGKEEKVVLFLYVAEGTQTPYYYVGDGNRIAYYRVGNESVPADGIKLRELVLKGTNYSFDSLRSPYNFSDYAFTKLKSVYKQRTNNTFEDADYESWGIIEDGKLTNAGALLADESPIRYSRLFCTRWNGLDKASGILDALDDREFSGSLILLLQNGMEFVKNNSRKKWMKTGNGRVELPDYGEQSVLEGIVNALIHRSYLDIGSEVHIDMYDDRLEIYSPGGMCDGTTVQNRDIKRIPSKRRNPVIADIFNRLRYMERRGSGFKKICADYENQTLYTEEKAPEFYSDYDSFILTLKNLNYKKVPTKSADKRAPIKSADKRAPIKSTDKKKVNKNAVKTEMQIQKILSFMQEKEEYRLADICEVVGLKETRTKILLRNMIADGNVEAIGERKGRRYRITEKH